MNSPTASTAKTIFIFRHGETDWNLEGRFQGHTDIPLNETGRGQALRLRKFFEREPVEIFLSSDLSRAFETARIAAGASGVEIVVDRRLRETHLGQAEGMKHTEVKGVFGEETIQLWASVDPAHRHHRFPGGESKVEHVTRLLDGIESFLKSTSYAKVGVASHGGAIRRLLHHFRPELTDPVMIPNCVLYVLSYDPGRGQWSVDLTPR